MLNMMKPDYAIKCRINTGRIKASVELKLLGNICPQKGDLVSIKDYGLYTISDIEGSLPSTIPWYLWRDRMDDSSFYSWIASVDAIFWLKPVQTISTSIELN